ncbi:MAG: 2-dehydro-3-deoxygalactonokinase, partial [Bacteroidia bacterium]|nr:2-dehydro-3-deoxygalactonokinase [Bacteroidia bacterium]
LKQNTIGRQEYFSNYLWEQIQMLPSKHREHLVISSGMTSSNIGLCELEYADLPFHSVGDSLVWKYITQSGHNSILLISGVKSESGMMRGEEVQAIGLGEYISPFGKGILILPGTHSKHIGYNKDVFHSLKTYMTGEFFDVLITHSILSSSVKSGPWNSEAELVFEAGVRVALKEGLTSNLFSVRARDLIMNHSKEDNYFYLSGLLIGEELSYLKNSEEMIFLAAPDPVFNLYQKALKSIVPKELLVFFDGRILEDALLKGQRKLLELHEKQIDVLESFR